MATDSPCPASANNALCTYSRAIDQPYPRLCVRCHKPEPAHIVGAIVQGHAVTSPDAKATLDDLMVSGVIAKDGSIELTEAMETLTGDTASAFTEYRAATVGLRDAELALKAAQERYRNALGGLNNAIAKVGG